MPSTATRSFRLTFALALLCAAPLFAQGRAPAPVRTGFDPRLDGMPFENLGDYASPDGNCFGMSLLAVDNYIRRRAAREAGHPDPAPLPITHFAHQGHAEAQILASLAQAVAGQKDDEENSPVQPTRTRDPRMVREAIERMRQSGLPEPMGVYSRDGAGHEVVLFGYEGGQLLIYDPNFPGQTIRWPWDPARGLLRHPMGRDDPEFYGALTEYDVAPFSAFKTSRELAAIRDACAQGLDRCVARFPALTGRVEGQTVVGTVGPGLERGAEGNKPKKPYRVWVVVDGKPVASARIQRDGTYQVKLPPGTRTDGVRVQVIAVTAAGAMAGANDVGAPAASQGFTSVFGR